MIRPGGRFTVAAVALAVVTAVVVTSTASEARLVVGQLAAIGVLLHFGFVGLGSARWLGTSSLPMLLAAGVEATVGDSPSWIRSVVIGALWFVSIEAGWEAIGRRTEAGYSAAANARRLQELATVVGLSLVVGLAATVTASFAPVRTVTVQAAVIGGVLIVLLLVVRHLSAGQPMAKAGNNEDTS